MTVGELKALLAEVPDDWPVVVYDRDTNTMEADARRWHHIPGTGKYDPETHLYDLGHDCDGTWYSDAFAEPEMHPPNAVLIS